jgi:hypothetical protein
MNKPLISLINKKIEQLERYNEITSRMIYEDIEGVGELIEQRQDIITSLDGVSVEIKKFVSEQSIEHQNTLNKILKFEDITGLTGDLQELQKKIKESKKLVDVINKNDKLAYDRLKKMQDDILVKMENAQKGKKVVNYLSQTAIDLSKGSRLNISH